MTNNMIERNGKMIISRYVQDADLFFDFVESVNDCFKFDNDGSSFY